MATELFLRLTDQDPYAFERLRRLAQRSWLRVGVGGARLERSGVGLREGWAMSAAEPWVVAALLGSLFVVGYGALLQQARPTWGEWLGVKWLVCVASATTAVLTWTLGRLRTSPVASVETLPDPWSSRPLGELHGFSLAKAKQLQAHARLQRRVMWSLVPWLLLLVAGAATLQGLGASCAARSLMALTVLGGVYVVLEWQPFETARRRERLAEEARLAVDAMGEALAALDAQRAWGEGWDPELRADAEWKVVRDLLGSGPAWVAWSR